MKKVVFLLLLILQEYTSYAQEGASYKESVSKFINLVKNNKWEKLAASTRYPLKREYPLSSINNKTEFLKRYGEVFDATLVKKIVKSSVSKDWSAVGWRGIMLLSGDVWLDYDGNVIAVNYQSTRENAKMLDLINIDRKALHVSLRTYQQPVCIFETSKFRIRIDALSNSKYRYASWPLKSKMSDKPDLIIENGTVMFDGNGGNHSYIFKNGEYNYECSIIEMGETDDPPATLTIDKNGTTILSQRVTRLLN